MSSRSILQAIRVEDGIFWFHLDKAIVDEIKQRYDQSASRSAIVPVEPLTVPRWLRQLLRKASLFDISEETASHSDKNNHQNNGGKNIDRFSPRPLLLQSGITFISRYPCIPPDASEGSENHAENNYVLETIVSLDGDILNKIKKNFLDTDTCRDVSTAHFWLIDQLLSALRQDNSLLLNTLTIVLIPLPILSSVGMSLLSIHSGDGNGLQETIERVFIPLMGSGFSGLMYGSRQQWRSWIHNSITKWGFSFIKKKLNAHR